MIKPAFQAMKSYKERQENLTIEDLPELEKHFFNKQNHSGLEFLEENIHSKRKPRKWYEWGKALNYLLYEYELHHDPKTSLNFDGSIESIEHILPKNPDKGYNTKEKNLAKKPHVVHALGNLLLINF